MREQARPVSWEGRVALVGMTDRTGMEGEPQAQNLD